MTIEQMKKEKRKAKARKHLQFWREDLEFWQEKYVGAKRDKDDIIDVKLMYLDGSTLRQERIKEAIEEINEAKEKIARFERYAL